MSLIHLHDYDASYNPSMPSVSASISRDDTNIDEGRPTTFIVDSGADITLIPVRILKDIGAKKRSKRQMIGVSGVAITVDMYVVVLKLGKSHPLHLEVIGAAGDTEPILGRDVLNQYAVLLNGPGQTVEVSE